MNEREKFEYWAELESESTDHEGAREAWLACAEEKDKEIEKLETKLKLTQLGWDNAETQREELRQAAREYIKAEYDYWQKKSTVHSDARSIKCVALMEALK